MAHVYISYRHEDADFVADLIRQIEDAGFAVWSDTERMRAGEKWREAIDQAIRDAFAMLVVLSPASKSSEQMMYEWTFALGVGVPVITILLQPVDIHPRLEPLPRLDFSEPSALPWGKLLRTVQEAHGTRSFGFRPRGEERPPLSPFGPRPASLLDRIRRREGASIFDDDDDEGSDDLELAHTDNLSRLLKALDGDNRDARLVAVQRLGKLGDKAAVPALIRLLREEDWRLRNAAAQALGKLKAVGAVVGMLEIVSSDRRSPFSGGSDMTVLADAIRDIGSPAIPILVDALSDDDPHVRLFVVNIIGEFNSPEALAALAETLRDPEWRVRWRAADALGKLASPAAVPDLIALLHDSSKDVRMAAAWALGQIRSADAVPDLIKLLPDRDWRVRWSAAEALWTIGEDAIQALIEVLGERDDYVRRAAIRALAEIGEPAIPQLLRALGHSNWDVRCGACDALEALGDQAVPPLVQVLSEGDWQVSWAAAETLRQIGTPDALKAFEEWRGTQGEDSPDMTEDME